MKILVDTREQKDVFSFVFSEDEVVRRKLDVGDYSIEGFENKITIERKRSTMELHICLFSQWGRFERELKRMQFFDEAYVICTFPEEYMYTFPKNSTIPKKSLSKLKVSAGFLRKKYYEVQEKFPDITFVYGNSFLESEIWAYNTLKDYHDRHITG